ncbi:MAG: hypothetical protein M1824_005438 [Vezdaea acicularis]|nr:MAG: hypothetical protein M1824_005438 [Vezdaea acicularis]
MSTINSNIKPPTTFLRLTPLNPHIAVTEVEGAVETTAATTTKDAQPISVERLAMGKALTDKERSTSVSSDGSERSVGSVGNWLKN